MYCTHVLQGELAASNVVNAHTRIHTFEFLERARSLRTHSIHVYVLVVRLCDCSLLTGHPAFVCIRVFWISEVKTFFFDRSRIESISALLGTIQRDPHRMTSRIHLSHVDAICERDKYMSSWHGCLRNSPGIVCACISIPLPFHEA